MNNRLVTFRLAAQACQDRIVTTHFARFANLHHAAMRAIGELNFDAQDQFPLRVIIEPRKPLLDDDRP